MDNQIKKAKWGIIPAMSLVFIIILIFDYFNIPSHIGLSVGNVHLGTTGDVLNVLMAFGIFIFTFRVIDEREIKKNKNARSTAIILMRATYASCLETLSIVDNQYYLAKHIVPKIDFNRSLDENKIEKHLMDDPFKEDKAIIDLAKDGMIKPEEWIDYLISKYEIQPLVLYEWIDYLRIVDLYHNFITLRITFFDIDYASQTDEQYAMKNKIATDRLFLKRFLEEKIEKINHELENTGLSNIK